MYKKLNQIIPGVYNFIADDIESAQHIPVDSKAGMMGSECYVISEQQNYVLGSGFIWYSKAGEGSFECTCGDIVEESTIWENIPAVAAARKKNLKK